MEKLLWYKVKGKKKDLNYLWYDSNFINIDKKSKYLWCLSQNNGMTGDSDFLYISQNTYEGQELLL